MLKRIVIPGILILLLACYLLIFKAFDHVVIPFDSQEDNIKVSAEVKKGKTQKAQSQKVQYGRNEQLVYRFICKNLICKNGGILSSTKPGSEGQDTLSESVGLLMTYGLKKGDKSLWDREFKYLTTGLMTKEGFVQWKTGKNKSSCNALIDDLRILRVILDAYALWGNEEYKKTGERIREGIVSYQVNRGNIAEFFDWKAHQRKYTVPLCYLDISTMQRLSKFDSKWKAVAAKSLQLLKAGKTEEKSPFYYKYYDYSNKTYSLDEEFRTQKGICLTYTLLTALHLAEADRDTSGFHTWMKKEMRKGKLYAWYNPKTTKPSQTMESTAVYALAALYSYQMGDVAGMEKLLNRMMVFMVKNKKSPYYGGFGNAATGEFYSFDNLTALLALAAAQK